MIRLWLEPKGIEYLFSSNDEQGEKQDNLLKNRDDSFTEVIREQNKLLKLLVELVGEANKRHG